MGNGHTQPANYGSLLEFVIVHGRGSTHAKLARRMGLTPGMLSAYLAGTRTPGKSNLIRLSKTYGISVEGMLSAPAAVRRHRPARRRG